MCVSGGVNRREVSQSFEVIATSMMLDLEMASDRDFREVVYWDTVWQSGMRFGYVHFEN